MSSAFLPLRSNRLGAALLAGAGALMLAAPAVAAVPVTEVIRDPFTNPTSQHRTAVEPDTFAAGDTIVAASQVGRFFDGGASDIGVATSKDRGTTWSQKVLPGITPYKGGGGSFERVSDPSVAFDAKHNVWLVSSIPLLADLSVPAVFVSRSTDGGSTWGNPVTVASAGVGSDFDKNWTACDNNASSPFYGNCYTTFDDFGDGDRLKVSTSTDGGLTWGQAKNTANDATGLGGQPVVQSNGTVIIPASNAFETAIIAFRSTDGGNTWSPTVTISPVKDHTVAGNLRSGPLPSAEIDATGKVYVVWQDCRFGRGCRSNDIVMSTSTDGVTWSAVTRIPIDATTSKVDHFIPGIGVDPATSTAGARLGLTYYFYRDGRCGRTTCQLEVGHIQSVDGGTSWSDHVDVAGPFPVTLIANTTQGRMVGDYISTSWVGGRAFGAFAAAQTPRGGFAFEESIFVPTGGLTAAAAQPARREPVSATSSDHPVRTQPARVR